MATTKEEYVQQRREANKTQEDADIAAAKGVFDTQAKNTKDIYNNKIEDTTNSYEDKFRLNETQRYLNSRAIERRAAEMGLTDSGMNRTQQTAVQLSYANQKGELSRQMQGAIDTLAATMAADLATIEANKAAKEQEIRSSYAAKADSEGLNLFNAEQDRISAENIAKIEAEAEQQKAYYSYLEKQAENNISNYASDKKDLYSHLQQNNTDPDYAAQMIYAYCEKYDIDPNTSSGKADLNSLLSAAQLTEGEYKQYIGTGSIYGSAEDYVSGNTNARIKWNYKTDGTQKYKIKVVKDTINWGWGVDNDAIVDIYYPDGTVLKKNVKLASLTKNNATEITKLTKGSGNEGKVEYLNLDLSKENLG